MSLDIKELSAYASGIIEYGYVSVAINNIIVNLSIEHSSDGSFSVFIDDYDTKTIRDIFIGYEILERNEIEDEEFIDHIYSIYQNTTKTQGGTWTSKEYVEDDFEDVWNEEEDFGIIKEKLIKTMKSFYEEYDAFTSVVASKNWRGLGILQNIEQIISIINNTDKGDIKEFEYALENDKKMLEIMEIKFPKKYDYLKDLLEKKKHSI